MWLFWFSFILLILLIFVATGVIFWQLSTYSTRSDVPWGLWLALAIDILLIIIFLALMAVDFYRTNKALEAYQKYPKVLTS